MFYTDPDLPRKLQAMSDTQNGWINAFPELKTRPGLMSVLWNNRRLRAKLFHAFNVLHHVSNLPDVDVASETLAIMADYYWERIKAQFKDELESYNVQFYNELVGLYRNLVLNMRLKIKPTRQWRVKNEHWVRRAA